MDVVLVAGLWLDTSVWDDVVPGIEAAGHRPVPVALPGQGDGRSDATLEDQVGAVLAAVDDADGDVVVVGHSAACTLAWLAADRRPDRVRRVVLIGGFPAADGEDYASFLPIEDGVMRFPGWEPFEGPDSDDLDDEARQRFAERAIPVPEGVANGRVTYAGDRRHAVPVVLVCPEFSPEDARGWIEGGDVPELAATDEVTMVDIDSGHWPMLTKPDVLARILADAV